MSFIWVHVCTGIWRNMCLIVFPWVHTNVYLCVCFHVPATVCDSMHMQVNAHMCACERVDVCVYMYVWMHLWACVSVYLYKCACLRECKVMTAHVICLERKWFREKCGLKSEWPHELEYYLCHILAVYPWESCLTSLDLHCLVYIIDIKTYLPYTDIRRIAFTNRSKTLNRYLALI